MGLLQTIGLRKKDVEAQLSPPIMQQTYLIAQDCSLLSQKIH